MRENCLFCNKIPLFHLSQARQLPNKYLMKGIIDTPQTLQDNEQERNLRNCVNKIQNMEIKNFLIEND